MHIFRISLSAIASLLAGANSALACSFLPYEVYDYSPLEIVFTYDRNYQNPEHQDSVLESYREQTLFQQTISSATSIHISTVDLTKVEIDEGYALWQPRFIPKEVLKGPHLASFPYLSGYGKSQLVLNRDEMPHVQSQGIAKPRDLWFWDSFPTKISTGGDSRNITSCGPKPLPLLSENSLYLIVQEREHVSKIIPIEGTDDKLVAVIKSYLEGDHNVLRPKIEARSFLSAFEAVAVVKVSQCSDELKEHMQNGNVDNSPVAFRGIEPKPAKIDVLRMTAISDEKDRKGKLIENWRSLWSYFENTQVSIDCSGQQTYLVLWMPEMEMNPTSPLGIYLNGHLPPWRYARITDGIVNLEDVKTNYRLTSDSPLPADEILEAIEHSLN